MFRHILVPTDLTKNRHALDIAVKLARHDEGIVTLLHVVESIADASYEEFEDFYATLRERAGRVLEEMIAESRPGSIRIVPEILLGNRAQEILRFADQHGVDLIVMNSHRVDLGDPAQGWGTISYKVGILSPCPVMLVK